MKKKELHDLIIQAEQTIKLNFLEKQPTDREYAYYLSEIGRFVSTEMYIIASEDLEDEREEREYDF